MSNITKEDLQADVERIVTKLGHTPSLREYKICGGKYSRKPFRKQFGSWSEALRGMGYCPQEGGGDSPVLTSPVLVPNYKDRSKIRTVGDTIIAFDLHSPYHDPEMIIKLLECQKKYNIKTLILGGDTTDFKSLFFKESQDAEFTWTEEMRMTKELLKVLAKHFQEIYWIKGNHDQRLSKFLNSNKEMLALYRLILDVPNLYLLDTFYCEVNDWLLVNHPTRARRNKTSFIEDLCRRYRKSVLNGHTHRFVFAVDDTGIDDTGTKKVVTIASVIDEKVGIYLQLKYENSTLDEPVEITGIDLRVAVKSSEGITEAADTVTS